MEDETNFPPDSDLDFSFTSCASTTSTDRTLATSSARSSAANLACGEVEAPLPWRRPHRSSDPHWSAIVAATRLSSDGRLHLRHLHLLRHLGSGNLGRVYLCRLKGFSGDDATFALKVVDRDSLTELKLSHVRTEAELLSSFDHPFLPTLYARVEASHYTCLLIDYCAGGDLLSLLRRQPRHRLPLPSARFYAAEVLVALEYLHFIGVVYRDLKPENVLRRADGHVVLSDFDLSFRSDFVPAVSTGDPPEISAEPNAAFSVACVGTHEYLAPEVVAGEGGGAAVDWWALGIFLYELLYGRTPFRGESKAATLRRISLAPLRFPASDGSSRAEEEAAEAARDLIARLLERNRRTRLGCAGGAVEIRRHEFFRGIKWPLIRCYPPPRKGGHVRGSARVESRVTGAWSWRRLKRFLQQKSIDGVERS